MAKAAKKTTNTKGAPPASVEGGAPSPEAESAAQTADARRGLAGAEGRPGEVGQGEPAAAETAGDPAHTPEGRSGTAREAPSAGSGPEAASASDASGGAQPAAPSHHQSHPEGLADAPSGDLALAVAELALVVRGPRSGRWRAGRHFGPEPVTVPLAELSEAETAMIEGDPLLTVRREVIAP